MKKLSSLFIVSFAFLSACSSGDDSESQNGDSISNSPVSGVLYGEAFTIGGGYASRFMLNVETINLNLTAAVLDCDDAANSLFPISVSAPAVVGTHTSGTSVYFSDPASDDFVSVGSGVTVVITSMTENLITGKVSATSVSTDNSIDGAFSLPICQ